MRLASLALVLGASALGAAQAIGAENTEDPEHENTYFNDQKVPPLLELNSDNYEKEFGLSKNLVVKFYSPWCPHCIDFAPTYQTLYEFYYTQSVEDPKTGKTVPFEEYYDLRFAYLNCIAFADTCTKLSISTYPQVVFYTDGKAVDAIKGNKNMTLESGLIEKNIKDQKPATRPTELELPEPGDLASPAHIAKNGKPKKSGTSSKTTTGEETVVLEKEDVKEKEPAKAKEATPTKPKVDPWAAANVKPAKATSTPNPQGISVSLTAESFQQLVTMTQEPWFIKFYAPWCHHCQAMASNWQQLAKEMKGKLNIGEVNCDAESRLCKDVRLHGYPTILFFRGGERVEYNGLRGLGDFLQYADKALDICSGIQDVDQASFEELEKTEDVIFVYFYDHATTSEDFLALERLPLSLIGHAKLVKTRDVHLYERFKITTWPRLLVAREGRPTYYNPLTPNEMRNTRQVLTWMKSVWLPIVPELTASNAREIMDGKIVVLGILNREDDEAFLSAKREMKSAANEWMDKQIQLFQMERQDLRDAKQLRIEEAEDRNDQRALRNAKSIRIDMNRSDRKEVAFAWVDGTFWQRWIRTTYGIDAKDGERVIINDEDNRRYWDQTITGNYIIPSRTSILETISKVTASPPMLKPKLTISAFEKVFFDIRMAFTEHPIISYGGVVIAVLFGLRYFRGRLRGGRGNFRISENLPVKEIREGLLGNTANGKTD
ncbi:thioredoxin [Microdochium trichocladiopsis]|uniref:Thioredoxin n=1 Tax=Microdochium trichocladiopsis TaxID=1682393 RepID=A0A9P9BQU6_9PEZI|nr:thioredoxin [Microdochium trichocladiopsis]KAH7031278.1 thioredoxin [Microdochium trichocladiopsis]